MGKIDKFLQHIFSFLQNFFSFPIFSIYLCFSFKLLLKPEINCNLMTFSETTIYCASPEHKKYMQNTPCACLHEQRKFFLCSSTGNQIMFLVSCQNVCLLVVKSYVHVFATAVKFCKNFKM